MMRQEEIIELAEKAAIRSKNKAWAYLKELGDWEDLKQEAILISLKAAKKFDTQHSKANLERFISAVVCRYFKRLNKSSNFIRIPEYLYCKPRGDDKYKEFNRIEEMDLSEINGKEELSVDDLFAVLEKLPEEDATLLMRRYGIKDDPVTLQAIADEEGCLRGSVHFREKRALAAARALLDPSGKK